MISQLVHSYFAQLWDIQSFCSIKPILLHFALIPLKTHIFIFMKVTSKYHHHQCFLPKSRSFTANSGTKAAVLLKGRSSTANSGTKIAVLLGIIRCGSFPLLSAPHSLFSIWTDLKRSEKISGVPAWKWEWIWLTGPSGLHRNSPQVLNITIWDLTRSEIWNPNHTSPTKI